MSAIWLTGGIKHYCVRTKQAAGEGALARLVLEVTRALLLGAARKRLSGRLVGKVELVNIPAKQWALCTSRSRMASVRVASPITTCQSLRRVELAGSAHPGQLDIRGPDDEGGGG